MVTLLCALFVLIMLSITFLGTSYQLLTGDALSWTYSLARQFVPWIGLLSITVAFKHADHVAVNMLAPRLPRSVARVMQQIVVASIAVFAVLMIWQGMRFWFESTQLVMISDQLQISQRWVVASVPAMGVVMLIHSIAGHRLLENASTSEAMIDELLQASQAQPAANREAGR